LGERVLRMVGIYVARYLGPERFLNYIVSFFPA